jgi:lipoprotein-releasing system permease protein
LNLSLFIAQRYLLSKRKKNFINVISIISVVAVAIITTAIIIVLSIFNGLGDLIQSLNNSFDPEIKIVATKGKSFNVNDGLLQKVVAVPGVEVVTEVIQDFAYARYNNANQLVTVKGVSDNFIDQHRIPAQSMVEGELLLKRKGVPRALIGYGVKSTLSISMEEGFHLLQLYYIKNVKSGVLDPSKLYTQKGILPGGVFSIIQSFDENYVVVPLEFAQELMSYEDKRTSLEIKARAGTDIAKIEKQLQVLLGDSFDVLNSEEQHQDVYRVLKLEKLFAFIAAVMLLIIGSINIYFNLMMLALDKKRDITILAAMGADKGLLKKVFITEGLLIAAIGTCTGLLLGAGIVLIQQKFGLISMGMNSSVVDGYPVKLAFFDFVYVFLAMSAVTIFISSKPASLAAKVVSVQHL